VIKNYLFPDNLILYWIRKLKEEEPLFLVGGSVRDFLLQRAYRDYDFLLEGDVFSFVSRLKEKIGGKAVFNKRFLTATLKLKEITLDFASARKEHYSRPGSLPRVMPTSWQEDLKRRDFTINTLAIPLLKEGWGEIIDLCDGQKDLSQGLIRILHEQSFKDDPTRILRAIRYKNRLGFTIEKTTLERLKQSWPYLEKVSPRRRLKEWQLLCTEDTVEQSMKDIFDLGGWPYFTGGLLSVQQIKTWASWQLPKQLPKEICPWYYYLLLFLIKEQHQLAVISSYWGLYPQEKDGLKRILVLVQNQKQLDQLTRRQLLARIKELPSEGRYFLFRENPQWGESWDDFCQEIIANKMPVRGSDLLKLGIKQGPEVGKLLLRLEEFYRMHFFNTKKEGLELANRLLKGENK
jgi:tRNA nucleotidyltransferase (CCA-adding enzyme)